LAVKKKQERRGGRGLKERGFNNLDSSERGGGLI